MPLLINGQPFEVPQGLEIDESNPCSLTPLAGGIKVQWSPEDFEIISGQSSTTSSSTDFVTDSILYFSVDNTRYVSTDGFVGRFALQENGNRFTGWVSSNSPSTLVFECGDGYYAGYWQNNPNNSRLSRYAPNEVMFDEGLILQLEKQTITVTSNTEAISQRVTNTNPSITLLAGNCGLVVNYSNGSQSPLIEFPVCPTVTIEPDCPCVCPSTLALADLAISLIGN